MPPSQPSLAILGSGNLGLAIARGAIAAGVVKAAEVVAIDTAAEARARAEAMGIRSSGRTADAKGAARVLLSVKPQVAEEVIGELAPLAAESLAISVMGGWKIGRLHAALGSGSRVARAMPNMAAQIGKSITALAFGPGVGAADHAWVRRLFESVGAAIDVDERLFDAVTAVSGSGPAYLFYLAEAEMEAAKKLGFDERTAKLLVTRTLSGAAALLESGDRTPQELRATVTSKGGTTAAAISVMESRGLPQTVMDAIRAAADRAAELGSR